MRIKKLRSKSFANWTGTFVSLSCMACPAVFSQWSLAFFFFVWEAFLWGWEPGDKRFWFWMHLIWSADLCCGCLALRAVRGMRCCHFGMLCFSSHGGCVSIPVHIPRAPTNTPLVFIRSVAPAWSLAPCHVHLKPLLPDLWVISHLGLAQAPGPSCALMPWIAPPKESLCCIAAALPFPKGGHGWTKDPPARLGLPGPRHLHMNGAVHLHLLQPLFHCHPFL